MADYKRIILSSQFTFLVGEDKTRLTIHAAILQDLSDPLHALINNGHMIESQTGVGTLDDVEVETFIGFCEYAYTDAYETPDFKSPLGLDSNDNTNRSGDPPVSDDVPEPEPEPEHYTNHEFWDKWDEWPPSTRRRKKQEANRKCIPARIEIPNPGPPAPVDIVYPYELLWQRFRSLKFSSEPASVSPNPDVLFHAKLYVFATKYLIESLRQQCLASMHRDLKNFSLNRENRSRILDLLDFTYTHTGRGEGGGRSPLRDLVIHYVACEVRTLADDEKLTEILDSNAEIGSDLVLKLVR